MEALAHLEAEKPAIASCFATILGSAGGLAAGAFRTGLTHRRQNDRRPTAMY